MTRESVKDSVKRWGPLLSALVTIAIALISGVSIYAVTGYQTRENTREIQQIKRDYVPRTEFNMLMDQLKRIEDRIKSTDDHILQHIDQTTKAR